MYKNKTIEKTTLNDIYVYETEFICFAVAMKLTSSKSY